MENLESILEELEKFEKKSGVGVSKVLEEYIQHVAKTGDTVFPWHRIRHFMRHMLETVMNEFYENCGGEDMSECGNVPAFSYSATRDKLLHHFDTFAGAPFTIQRLCEIMVDPTRHYKRTDKFLRGLEKNVLVVSNIEPGRQRRTEDAQQTLVNGLQESGLHTTTISVSSATSPMSHLTKRLSLAPSANSVTNNTNETYSREMNESDNQVTGSEANGPSGLHREDISDTLTETTEPPSKKVKTTDDTFEDKATGSADEMPQIQEEKCNSYNPVHDAESMEAEASEDGSDTSSSSSDSSSAKAEAMELREAEATCHTVKVSEEKEVNLSQERLGQQVGTSELVPQDSTELTKEVRHKIEDKDESLSSVSPEVCSSNSSHRSVPEKLEEENDTTDVLSTSAAATTNAEGSPDSVEGTSEVVHPQFEQMKDTTQDEREGSSEAAAAAANSSRSELAHVSEMPCIEEEKSKDSHEADSTSQAQSNSVSSQPTSSPVATSPSATSSPSPSSDASSATPPDPSIAPSVASPPDTAAHTTSQTLSSSSASSPTPVTASTSSPVRDSPDPTTGTDNAASTSSSSLPQSDSTVGQEPDNTSSDSLSVETNNKNEKDAGNVSCSSSQSNESEVKNQLMK